MAWNKGDFLDRLVVGVVHNLTQALTNDSKITHSRTTFHKTLLVIADHVRHVRVDERMQDVLKNREIADKRYWSITSNIRTITALEYRSNMGHFPSNRTAMDDFKIRLKMYVKGLANTAPQSLITKKGSAVIVDFNLRIAESTMFSSTPRPFKQLTFVLTQMGSLLLPLLRFDETKACTKMSAKASTIA
jgi:hypothetical protein